MKNLMKPVFVYLFMAFLFIGCDHQAPKTFDLSQLSRVDIQVVQPDGNYGDEVIIPDLTTLNALREVFGEIKWDPNIEVNIGQEDVKASLFYRYDKNKPERVVGYRIWFNENGVVNILSSLTYENYGKLDGDHAQVLKQWVFNNFEH